MTNRLNNNVPDEDRDKIWSYMIPFEVYLVNNITPANRFFVPHHKFASPDIFKQCDIKLVRPDWMLISGSNSYCGLKEDSVFLSKNYVIIDSLPIGNLKLNLIKKINRSSDNKEF